MQPNQTNQTIHDSLDSDMDEIEISLPETTPEPTSSDVFKVNVPQNLYYKIFGEFRKTLYDKKYSFLKKYLDKNKIERSEVLLYYSMNHENRNDGYIST